jgi:hypothetical protein
MSIVLSNARTERTIKSLNSLSGFPKPVGQRGDNVIFRPAAGFDGARAGPAEAPSPNPAAAEISSAVAESGSTRTSRRLTSTRSGLEANQMIRMPADGAATFFASHLHAKPGSPAWAEKGALPTSRNCCMILSAVDA